MKILLGTPEYQPYHVGGGGEVYKQLAENYKKLGNEVVVVYGYYPTNSWSEEIKEYTKDGIKFYQIPEIPYPKSMPFLRTVMPPNPKSWFKLKAIIKKENPDVAHLHGYGFLLVNKLAKILKKQNVKYIFTLHGYPETQNKKGFLAKILYGTFEKFSIQKALKGSSKITGVSDYISQDTRISKFQDKTLTVLNGINQEEYLENKGNKSLDIYKELLLKKGKDLTIFSMGRISKMKGFHLVIEKMNFFIKNGINLHYIIAGTEDGFEKELKELIKKEGLDNNVHLIGWRSKKDIISLLHQCDLFSIPSLWDPCPIAAFEGMACNKLIITTESGGMKEIFKNYPYKINIYNKNFDRELLKIIKNKEYKNLKKIDLSNLSWKNVSNKYLEII